MKVKRAVNATAVKEREDWLIIHSNEDGAKQIVGSSFNLIRAERAKDILTRHDQINGHPGYYEIHHISTVECVN